MRKKKLVKSIVAVGLSACMVVGSTSVAFAKGTDFKYDADGNVIGTTGHVDADGHVATDYEYKLDKDGNMQYDEDGNVIKELIKKDEEEEKCDHVWVKRLTKSPTCTEEGEWTIFCGNCGESKTESIAATGHSWGGWTVTKEATCTEGGEEARTCETCGKTVTTTIPATGHKWTATSVETKEPTCTENGYTKKTCGVCGETETTTIPATGHKWTATSVETKEPTCTENGYTKKTCATCGETETTLIPAKGHGEEYTKGTEKGYAATCTTPGKTDVVRCKDCDAILKEAVPIPALGHEKPTAATGITVVKEANCTEEGEVSYTCTRCHETITEKTAINPDNHVWNGTGTYCKKCGKKKPATDA